MSQPTAQLQGQAIGVLGALVTLGSNLIRGVPHFRNVLGCLLHISSQHANILISQQRLADVCHFQKDQRSIDNEGCVACVWLTSAKQFVPPGPESTCAKAATSLVSRTHSLSQRGADLFGLS